MGNFIPLSSDDWARVRHDYESTDRKVFEICAEHGISESTLRDRMRRWGWTRRASGPVPREGPPKVVPIIEVNGLVPRQDAQGCGDEPPGDVDELREALKRQIDALIEEEREAQPRRYLAGWEEFAAEAAKHSPAGATRVGALTGHARPEPSFTAEAKRPPAGRP